MHVGLCLGARIYEHLARVGQQHRKVALRGNISDRVVDERQLAAAHLYVDRDELVGEIAETKLRQNMS